LPADTEATLDLLWAKAVAACWAHRWDEAVELLEAVARIRPDSHDVVAKLATARAESDLSQHFELAQAAEDAGEWEVAATPMGWSLPPEPTTTTSPLAWSAAAAGNGSLDSITSCGQSQAPRSGKPS